MVRHLARPGNFPLPDGGTIRVWEDTAHSAGMNELGCTCYCCLAAAEWYRVLTQAEAGVTVDPQRLDSQSLWSAAGTGEVPAQQRTIPWCELDVPLPHRGARCWGYALSYPEHRDETLHRPAFRFLKEGTVAANSEPIPYREFLDFELEIGVLMHRATPDRFGYFLANDLTDRGVQVQLYNRRNPAPGFTIAKSFPGSLRVGPLLALGDASLWHQLTATLTLNDEERQTLRAVDCHLNPRQLHRELFQEYDDPWLMVATGTSAGTLFRSPRFSEKLVALLAGRLSAKRAGRRWLGGLRFLVPGDKLVLYSPILGRSETHVV